MLQLQADFSPVVSTAALTFFSNDQESLSWAGETVNKHLDIVDVPVLVVQIRILGDMI